jgi:hypothetical protein
VHQWADDYIISGGFDSSSGSMTQRGPNEMDDKKSSSFRWTNIGDLMASVAVASPGKDEWDRFIADLGSKPITRYISCTVGQGELDSVKRKQASDILSAKKIRVAVVTDERLVRGFVTAASWLGVNIKAFSWMEVKDAIRYVGFAGDAAIDQIYKIIFTLRQEVISAPR